MQIRSLLTGAGCGNCAGTSQAASMAAGTHTLIPSFGGLAATLFLFCSSEPNRCLSHSSEPRKEGAVFAEVEILQKLQFTSDT